MVSSKSLISSLLALNKQLLIKSYEKIDSSSKIHCHYIYIIKHPSKRTKAEIGTRILLSRHAYLNRCKNHAVNYSFQVQFIINKLHFQPQQP